jgi:cysteine desulfurase/selenocysteine lyase
MSRFKVRTGLGKSFRQLPHNIRDDFPSLQKLVYGKRYAFLDSAASSLKPTPVVRKLSDFLLGDYANVHRGLYRDSLIATEAFEGARKTILHFFGGQDGSHTLVFTKGATEAINLAAMALVLPTLRPGDVILLTRMEHHANLVPWQVVARRTGAMLKYVPLTDEGRIDLEQARDMIQAHRPRLFGFVYVSNALGTVNPVRQLADWGHAVGAKVLVDAAQAGMHLPLDFAESGADMMVVSAHKMLGPTGVGGLIAHRTDLEASEPYQFGGDMIREVEDTYATWNDVPQKFEAGTPPFAEAVAWGAACQYLEVLGWEAIRLHEQRLLGQAYDFLSSDPRITVYGPKDLRDRSGVIGFNLKGIHAHDVGTILDREGVAVRAGHHCAQVLMKTLGIAASVRMSVGVYNTSEDIEQLRTAIQKAFEVFRQ